MNLPGPSGLNQDQGQVSSSKLILENHCFNQVDEYLSSLTVEERADIGIKQLDFSMLVVSMFDIIHLSRERYGFKILQQLDHGNTSRFHKNIN